MAVKHAGYKYRIYPNDNQIVLFNKTFGCVRFVYNKLLSDKVDYYEQNKKSLKTTEAHYKKDSELFFLKEVDSLALMNARLHNEAAFERFFKKKSKFPKYHKKGKCKDSYTTNNQKSGKNGQTIELTEKGLKLPKVGVVKIKLHKPLRRNY